MKRLLLTLLILHFLLFVSPSFAQNKLSRSLLEKVNSSAARKTSEPVAVLVKGDAAEVKQLAEQLGGQFRYSSGNISSVSIPMDRVSELAKSDKIIRIHDSRGKLILLNDKMLINNNAVPVHSGAAPLARSYEGDSVIVAILDAGIDFDHPDFRNPDGTTRIKYLWDQRVDNSLGETFVKSPLQPYGYGQEWTEQEINAGSCNQQDPWYYFNHGSHVSGIAAGNGRALNEYKGIAPKADLIVVSVDFNQASEIIVADAIDYVFKKADSLGKPCVVNMSFGDFWGSHDGKDPVAEFIDSKLKEKNGRAVVCAAGNYSNYPFHLGYEVETDSAFTWFIYQTNMFGNPAMNGIYFQAWADTADFQNVQFAVGADNPSAWNYRGRTSYYNVLSSYPNLSSTQFDSTDENITNAGGDIIANVKTYVTLDEGRYLLEVLLLSDSSDYLWRFITKGSGTFDAWSITGLTGTSDIKYTSLPDSVTFPDIKRYRLPDVNMTLTSSWGCSPNVLSVGMYQNRTSYTDINGDLQLIDAVLYEIAINSGIGPTRDGRQKPDLTASGRGVLSAIPSYGLWVANPTQIAWGGMHGRNGGTSMASPMVAGAVALYLQMKPDASYKEIICAVQQSAKQDTFTGNNLPDYQWGYGKLDVYSMLNQNIVCGCTDPTAINYNPAANCDDGNCIAVVYGCTDSTALNYNPNANFNDGSCFYTGIEEIQNAAALLANFPNPFSGKTVFHYKLNNLNFTRASITITDILGKEVGNISLAQSQGTILFNNNLPAGVYLYSLVADKKVFAVKRMMVVH